VIERVSSGSSVNLASNTCCIARRSRDWLSSRRV
jgi:hypothetical protein